MVSVNCKKKLFFLLFFLFGMFCLTELYAAFASLSKSEEKPKLQYRFDGVKGKNIQKNIDARLAQFIKSEYTEKKLAFTQYQSFVQSAPAQILQAMEPYGYYKPEITGKLVNVGKENIEAVFHVIPGEQMHVSLIHIMLEGPGKNEDFFLKSVKNFPLKEGEPLLTKKYTEGKQQLLDIATQNGYLKAEMQQSQIRINLKKYTSEIFIRLHTGQRFYFGPVSFSKTPYSDEYLRRYIPFKSDTPFVPNKLTTFQSYLGGTNQFKQVSIIPQYNNNEAVNQTIPVLVELEPQPSQSYTVGAGYGTDMGVRGSLGWNILNITPTGHKFNALIQASQLQSSIQGQYTIPGLNPTTEEYAITGSLYTLDYPDSKSEAAQLSVAYRTQQSIFQSSYSANTLYEHYTISEDPAQDAFIVYPGATWKTSKKDSPIFSKNGYMYSLTTQGSSEELASTVSFAQVEMLGKWAKTIKATHSRLYTRADLGVTAVDNIDNLPPSLQFYAGGAQSVRGYAYQDLGPGKALIVTSIEWQQEVAKDWYVTAFYDAGNAFNDTPIKLMRGVGPGIMWVTPIGPLNLSIAKALDQDPNDSGPWHIAFSMGPDL